MIKIETRAFERVNKVYPGARMGIHEAWKEGHGWIPFDQLYDMIGKPNIRSFSYLLNRIKKNGFSKVNLEIERSKRRPVYSDFGINELVRA